MTFKIALLLHLFIPIFIITLFTYTQLISKRKKFKTLTIHFALLLLYSSLIIYFFDSVFFSLSALFITQLIIAYFCYADAYKKVYQIVIYSFLLQILSLILTLIPLSFLYSITLQSTVYYDREFTIYALMLYDTWLLGLSFYYILEFSKLKRSVSFFKYSTLFICQSILGYIVFLLSFDLYLGMFIVIMLAVIVIIVMTNYILMKSFQDILFDFLDLFETTRNKEIMKQEMELKQIRKQIYLDIEKTQALLRRHLDNEAQDYIKNKCSQLKNMSIGRYSENKMIDIILYNKVKLMKDKHIQETVDISIQENINIDDIDLVTLLFNVLDNAIEACEKLDKKRFIHIKIFEKYNCIYVEVINSKNKYINSIHLKTTKEDTLNHGIGITIIKNIVNKYKGDVLFEDNGSTFRVKLFLKN